MVFVTSCILKLYHLNIKNVFVNVENGLFCKIENEDNLFVKFRSRSRSRSPARRNNNNNNRRH